MFAVLMYLFETYSRGHEAMPLDEARLGAELQLVGFEPQEIKKAILWLSALAAPRCETNLLQQNQQPSLRLYAVNEQQRLSVASRGFLLRLEQSGLLDSQSREVVIARLLDLDKEELTLTDLEWVVMMVLRNTPDSEQAFMQMEGLLLERETTIH